MDELLRNGSGYVDLTAYKAIKKADGGVNMNKGEIWEIKHGRSYRMAVVLAVHEKVCNVLVLNDEMYGENDFEVVAKGVKYTDPCMISYAFNDNFVGFVKCMKDHEFETLLDVIRGELGFNQIPNSTIENAEKDKCIAELEKQVRTLSAECNLLSAETNRLRKEERPSNDVVLMKAEIERDLYKNLYEHALEKLIG